MKDSPLAVNTSSVAKASVDFFAGFTFGGAVAHVVEGRLVAAFAGDDDVVQGLS